jgi:hypothetical protein
VREEEQPAPSIDLNPSLWPVAASRLVAGQAGARREHIGISAWLSRPFDGRRDEAVT